MTDLPNQTPRIATEAVLKLSDPVADSARQVKGVEFDDFRERDMTVKEMVTGMASMGFQASAVADAVRIINDMVRKPSFVLLACGSYDSVPEKMERT